MALFMAVHPLMVAVLIVTPAHHWQFLDFDQGLISVASLASTGGSGILRSLSK